MDNIESIRLIFNNGDNVSFSGKDFNDFYIANLNNNGEEIPYEPTIIKNKLYANFFMVKLSKLIASNDKLKRIKSKYDIIEIDVIFKTKKYIKFEVPSDAKPFNHNYNNNYEYIYEDDNTFGLLLSEHKIKYKENLFV